MHGSLVMPKHRHWGQFSLLQYCDSIQMYEGLCNTVHDLSYVYRLAWGMNCVFVYLGGCGNVQNPDISHNTLSVLIF